MTAQKRVLALGAHAADQELAAGMQIAKYTIAGHHVTILSLTPGEKGHPTLSAEEYAEQKIAEAQRCAQALGAESIVLGHEDALLTPTPEIKLEVADIMRDIKPDVLITHWKHSIHQDHEAAHAIAVDAAFYAGLRTITRARGPHRIGQILYSENWEDMEGFRPDLYLETTDVFERYREALSSFALWHGATGWPYADYYSSLARLRACLGSGLRWRYAAAMQRPRSDLIQRSTEFP